MAIHVELVLLSYSCYYLNLLYLDEICLVTYANYDLCTTYYRDVTFGGCDTTLTCDPVCLTPSQSCDLVCECAAGFRTLPIASQLTCVNIDDCFQGACLNGGTCIDGVMTYTCQCPIEYNRGQHSLILISFL